MEPDEFLTAEQVERLPDDEALAYVARVFGVLPGELEGDDAERKLTFIEHALDLAEHFLSAEEFDRLVRGPMWDAAFEASDDLVRVLEDGLASGAVPEDERSEFEVRLEKARSMAAMKRTLDDLPTTDHQ